MINSAFINNQAKHGSYYTSGDGAIYNNGDPCVANDNWWGTNTPNGII